MSRRSGIRWVCATVAPWALGVGVLVSFTAVASNDPQSGISGAALVPAGEAIGTGAMVPPSTAPWATSPRLPGPSVRVEIKTTLPAQTPASGIDYDRLAKLNVAGGNVHTIVLNAAFAAANAGTPVTMPLLLDAARIELRKLEKPINESELRWTEELAS